MSRNLLSRIARLEAVRSARKGEALIIVGTDRAECDEQLRQAEAAGRVAGREPVLILTGVPRSHGSNA
jgi:hypothetical protein